MHSSKSNPSSSENEKANNDDEITEADKSFIADVTQSSSLLTSMTSLGGKLTCAQVASRKVVSYLFNPTVLSGSTEFQDYLNILKRTPPPHRERFIITERHWIAGDIYINPNKEVSVLFMDSLGVKNIKEYETYGYIQQVANTFKNFTIYVPALQRQRDYQSCMVFALDDVRHFYTIERYLEDRFKLSGLHGYLSDSASRLLESKTDELITPCDMPLPFIRTLQYGETFFGIILEKRSPEERARPVNKDGVMLTKEYASAQFFNESKGEGARIKQVFEKMVNFNKTFLEKFHHRQALEEVLKPFSLAGFQERMTPARGVAPVVSSHGNPSKKVIPPRETENTEEPQQKRRKRE